MRNYRDAAIALAGVRPQGHANCGQERHVHKEAQSLLTVETKRKNASSAYAYIGSPS